MLVEKGDRRTERGKLLVDGKRNLLKILEFFQDKQESNPSTA